MKKLAIIIAAALLSLMGAVQCKKTTTAPGTSNTYTPPPNTNTMNNVEVQMCKKWIISEHTTFTINYVTQGGNVVPHDTAAGYQILYNNPACYMNLTNVWWVDTTGSYNIGAYKTDMLLTCTPQIGNRNWITRSDTLIFPMPYGPDTGPRYVIEKVTATILMLRSMQTLPGQFDRYYYHI